MTAKKLSREQTTSKKAIQLAGRIADMIESTGQPRPNMFDLSPVVIGLAKRAESIRKRKENSCSYEWACTERYEGTTEKMEKQLIQDVRELGLFAFIQGDCRGALLYVDAKPIDPSNYTSAVAVYL